MGRRASIFGLHAAAVGEFGLGLHEAGVALALAGVPLPKHRNFSRSSSREVRIRVPTCCCSLF